MRLFLLTLLIFLSIQVQAQLENGTYRSNGISEKENYILIVKDNMVSLYGWERLWSKRYAPTYFRSSTHWKKGERLTFKVFDYSKKSYTLNNLKKWTSDTTVDMITAILNRYFFEFEKLENGGFKCLSVKDLYDGRADTFYFEKIK